MDKAIKYAASGSKAHDEAGKAINILSEAIVLNKISPVIANRAFLYFIIKLYQDSEIPKQIFLNACQEAWEAYEKV